MPGRPAAANASAEGCEAPDRHPSALVSDEPARIYRVAFTARSMTFVTAFGFEIRPR